MERSSSRNPERSTLSATSMAMIASSRCHPVATAAPTPAMTPTEVQTSAMRCWASASRVMESCRLPTLSSTRATAKLTADATALAARPRAGSVIGCGSMNRRTAATTMPTAATAMSSPSNPLEKYSALVCP